ncbi:MAG: cyclodeaminase/cyclohydrolase family protein [Gaiella sp.]
MTEPAPRIPGLSVTSFVDELGAPAPAPSGGSAAAVSGAFAAALVGLVARASPAGDDGPGIAAQAADLRGRLLALADIDAEAFARALAALRAVADAPGGRDAALGAALGAAADAPLAIAEAAADVAELARLATEYGRPEVRPDAEVARELAAAAARGAAALVTANLATVEGDPRSTKAREVVTAVATEPWG